MATWTNLKTLGFSDPLQALERRRPTYVKRYAGEQDEFGFKLETFAKWEPIFRFCYEDYFKVDIRGLENIPNEGAVMLVGNHSGLLPIDAAMLSVAAVNLHPNPRRIRYVVTDWFFSLPGVREWIMETGQVRATAENARKLLDNNEIVGIYPEGLRGVGKTFRERYRLIDFHPGFVQIAIATQTPLVLVASVGGDEIFPNFVNVKSVSQLLKMPFYPLTPTFPWLPFPLMFFPLPVRWVIQLNKPIDLGYPRERATDKKLTLRLAREIQYEIQRELNKLLRERKSVFTGWDSDNGNDSKE